MLFSTSTSGGVKELLAEEARECETMLPSGAFRRKHLSMKIAHCTAVRGLFLDTRVFKDETHSR
jgi:hypothetical protein